MKTKLFLTGLSAIAMLAGCEGKPRIEPAYYTVSVSSSEGGAAQATVDDATVEKVLPETVVTLTATEDEGYLFTQWTTTTEGVTFDDENSPTTTFTMPEGDVTIEAQFEVIDDGVSVVINGVRWANRNVDAPGKFAETPESTGMYYQWNRETGWSATNPLKAYDKSGEIAGATWNPSDTGGDTWAPENDPSPEGWRVPTITELETLCDPDKVERGWQDSPAGYLFTDKESGNSIFFPVLGMREIDTGETFFHREDYGYYWSSSPHPNPNEYPDTGLCMFFVDNDVRYMIRRHACGIPVRPVAKDQ